MNLNIKSRWGVLGMRVPLQHSMSLQEARAVRLPAGRRGCQVRNWFLPIWQQYLFGNIQTNNDWVLSYCLLREHDRLWGCIVCNLNFFYQCAWIESNPNCLAPTLTSALYSLASHVGVFPRPQTPLLPNREALSWQDRTCLQAYRAVWKF